MTRDPSSNRLWHPDRPPETALNVFESRTQRARLWHQRLGHAHPDYVVNILKSLQQPPLTRKDFVKCDECSLGKSTQSPTTSLFPLISTHIESCT